MKQLIFTCTFLLTAGLITASDLNALVTNVSPAGANGAIDLTVTGGVAPFTYEWKGPGGYTASSEDINGLQAGSYTVTVTDSYCGKATLTVKVDVNTGIAAVKDGALFTVYPNPGNTGFVTLEASEPVKDAIVKLINMAGQTVMEQRNLNGSTFTFDISLQPAGFYFMEISEAGCISRKKLLKE